MTDSLDVSTATGTSIGAPVTSESAPTRPDIEVVSDAPRRGEQVAARYVLGVTRLCMGFVFLWAFLDKLFGLGRSTPAARSWLNGGSPTTGYLSAVDGPLAGIYHSLAGSTAVDWLFMMGLLGIGGALMLGIGLRVAAASGTVLLLMMYGAALPITSNPFLDEHIIYALVIITLALLHTGSTFGVGAWWNRLDVVNRFSILR